MTANAPTGQLRLTLQRATLVCLVLDLLLWGLFASPWSPSRARAEVQLSATTARDAALHAQVAELRRMEQRLQLSRTQAQELVTGSMPPQRSADFKLLSALQDIAQRTGVSAGSIGLTPARQPELGLLPVIINVKVAGSYGSLVQFINGVERSPLFLVVNQVALSSQRQAQGSSLSLAIQLEAFVQASGGSPEAPRAPVGLPAGAAGRRADSGAAKMNGAPLRRRRRRNALARNQNGGDAAAVKEAQTS